MSATRTFVLLAVVVITACAASRAAGREPAVAGAAQGAAQGAPRPLVFAAFYERGPAWDTTKTVFAQPSVREHIAHHEALGERLVAAAPFAPRAGDPAVGMVVLSAASAEEAQRWLERDPAVVSGVMRATLRRWGVRSVRAVGEPGR